jgi:hypothetical protein
MEIPNIVQYLYETPIKWILLFLHWILFSLPIIITLMTNDLTILIIINMFLFMVIMLNIIFKDCPITIIETLYLDNTLVDTITSSSSHSHYKLTRGDKTLQCLLIGIMIVTSKILLVLTKHTFIEYVNDA